MIVFFISVEHSVQLNEIVDVSSEMRKKVISTRESQICRTKLAACRNKRTRGQPSEDMRSAGRGVGVRRKRLWSILFCCVNVHRSAYRSQREGCCGELFVIGPAQLE